MIPQRMLVTSWSPSPASCSMSARPIDLSTAKVQPKTDCNAEPGVVIQTKAPDLKLPAPTRSNLKGRINSAVLQVEECQRRADECARLADATVNSILVARYRHLEASWRYLVRLKKRRSSYLLSGARRFAPKQEDLRCFRVAWLVAQHGAKRLGKLFIAKRLRERGVFSETRWKLARPIAGRENNRHAPSAKQVCDRIHYGPADIHIQDRGIEAGVGCQAKSRLHFSGRANHLAAEVEHHLLDEHRDHRLVLDNENSTPGLISHALPPLKGPRPRLTATITPEFLGRASAGALPRPTDPAPSGSFFFHHNGAEAGNRHGLTLVCCPQVHGTSTIAPVGPQTM